ncbi:3-keto-5-aminohexanoate cleavage protein [Noviherbaspirillum saxi]|uniref:3-keto-5-aminohexanoate cleavage protein n=1 Tax=Noviherbaspirillum saxi TaxID=2320863 RepID=A0A3A3GBB0_9BURK|nr:3-keto-5-aminohexanoate cleavage protein [Noviherbaspirillum saxi]RJF99485.1 3-keto-5-aminohexanoate cleavage protein [Noviherbaspirillum saxi]
MQVGFPFFINLACTGVIPTRAMSPHVPITHDEIVADVARALTLGVQMMHLHARDAEGVQTADPEPYGRLVEAIRALPGGRELIVGVTTSGRRDAGFESRARVLDLDGDAKPDMASLTLSSLNFVQSASVNAPDTIRRLAQRMRERGIRPELEVFDVGMANFARVLLSEGLVQAPLYVNVLLGNIAGAQPDLLQLAAILAALPSGCIVAIAGLGRFQLGANGLGLLMANGVRVGLEDNLWFDRQRSVEASNESLVQRIIAQAALWERPLMSRTELRNQLGMTI